MPEVLENAYSSNSGQQQDPSVIPEQDGALLELFQRECLQMEQANREEDKTAPISILEQSSGIPNHASMTQLPSHTSTQTLQNIMVYTGIFKLHNFYLFRIDIWLTFLLYGLN